MRPAIDFPPNFFFPCLERKVRRKSSMPQQCEHHFLQVFKALCLGIRAAQVTGALGSWSVEHFSRHRTVTVGQVAEPGLFQ